MAFSLKDYEIIDEIGRGSFGYVLRARQKSLGRTVAIKCLMPQRAQDRHDIVRFRREAEAMAALTHDNVVSVFDYAFYSGGYYIVMEYVEGMAFEQALGGAIGHAEALLVLERVAAGLACAHGAGLVHHDIKPGNILLGKQGQIKLADFGLATFQAEFLQHSSMAAAVGTLCYMAPEALVNPKEADRRVDIFSLGCMLYRVLSGKLPFAGESIGEISHKLLNEQPAELTLDGGTEALGRLAMSCLSKERDRRPPAQEISSAVARHLADRHHQVQETLAAFVRGIPSPKRATPPPTLPAASGPSRPALPRRIRVWGALAVVAVVLAVGAFTAVIVARSRRPASLAHLTRYRAPANGEPSHAPEGGGPTDQPAPVVSTALELNVGTLMLEGIGRDDTLFVNGKAVALPRGKTLVGIPLAPGPNRLEVRSAGRRTARRDIEIIPLQRVTWNLNEERAAHGRSKSR